MKIAVNTRLLLKDNLEGIGRFTHEIFSRMVKSHPEHEFHFFFDRPFNADFVYAKNVIPHVIPPPVRHSFLAIIWFEVMLKSRIRKLKPDVFISTDSMNMLKPICKSITVIHDINFEQHPENLPFILRKYYRYRTPIIARNSDLVATVSQYSKSIIATEYHIPEEKIRVIYNAASDYFHKVEEGEKTMVRKKYTDGKPYFVFLGGLYKRKNLVRLFKAYEIFKRNTLSDFKLVLIGRILKVANELLQLIEVSEFKNDVVLTGRINDHDETRAVLGSAFALTYVSTIEGFGMPMVEAMKCQVPVIAANTTSMPEIAGKAAVYVDPYDVEDIAKQMTKLFSDQSLYNELVEEAKKRSEYFNWDRSASDLWDSIVSLMD